ncbi:hypothetical protein C3L33_17857, partial [Rhododendron williamsianum]
MNRYLKSSLSIFINGANRFRPICSQISRHLSQSSANLEPELWESVPGLVRCPANCVPLSPISFLERSAKVATLAPNVPAMHELHFAVPMAGAVICTLNTRHDSAMLSVLLRHSKAKTLGNGLAEFSIRRPKSEWDPISVNYTSGTTSRPKGVVYSHRGAYLNSIATFLLHGMGSMPVYLWTVPMFHCNGWCLIWGVAALGGTNVCLRNVSPKAIFDNIALHKVTNMSGAPTILSMIVNSPTSDRRPLPHKVEVMTGGSPPPPQIFLQMEEMGFGVSQLYGLTETYGPGTSCVWKPEWDSLPSDEQLGSKRDKGSVEVETVVYSHPAVLEVAVVARPDDHWGQTLVHFSKDGINDFQGGAITTKVLCSRTFPQSDVTRLTAPSIRSANNGNRRCLSIMAEERSKVTSFLLARGKQRIKQELLKPRILAAAADAVHAFPGLVIFKVYDSDGNGKFLHANTRHDSAMLSILLRHSKAKVILVGYDPT